MNTRRSVWGDSDPIIIECDRALREYTDELEAGERARADRMRRRLPDPPPPIAAPTVFVDGDLKPISWKQAVIRAALSSAHRFRSTPPQ